MLAIWNRKFVNPSTINRTFSNLVEKVVSLETANQKQIIRHNVQQAIQKFQRHKTDTGSPPAQIVAMTEKINSLLKHFASHKKDKASFRGYQMLVAKRRNMLNYLKASNVEEYNKLVISTGLKF